MFTFAKPGDAGVYQLYETMPYRMLRFLYVEETGAAFIGLQQIDANCCQIIPQVELFERFRYDGWFWVEKN